MWNRKNKDSSVPTDALAELDDETLLNVYGGINQDEPMPTAECVTNLLTQSEFLLTNPKISKEDKATLQSALMALKNYVMMSSNNLPDIEKIISDLESKYAIF